jgi:hypothetical protein
MYVLIFFASVQVSLLYLCPFKYILFNPHPKTKTPMRPQSSSLHPLDDDIKCGNVLLPPAFSQNCESSTPTTNCSITSSSIRLKKFGQSSGRTLLSPSPLPRPSTPLPLPLPRLSPPLPLRLHSSGNWGLSQQWVGRAALRQVWAGGKFSKLHQL